jgi:hypothetical protein
MKTLILVFTLSLFGCGSTKPCCDDFNDSVFLCPDCDKNNLDSLP